MIRRETTPPGLTQLITGTRDMVPATARQLSLFDDDRDRAEKEVWQALRALLARHSADLFFRPVLTETDHPLPERRFMLQPLSYDPAVA